MLADANEEFRGMLRNVIDGTDGFTVAGSTGDGAEALRLCDELHPDLILMDVVLPGMDGFALMKRLRLQESGTVDSEEVHRTPLTPPWERRI